MLKSKGKILFKMSGSISCFKACELISKLVQDGFEVQTVISRAGLNFVGKATLEGLTGRPVAYDTFADGRMMEHIHLVDWADLVLLCPATAERLNQMSSGTGNDLLSSLFLAHDFSKPYVVAPAMNTKMLNHPCTQNSIQNLKQMGLHIMETGHGNLACGQKGQGRLLEVTDIANTIYQYFDQSQSGQCVLVTLGGTNEKIDGVRVLSNLSQGVTGSTIADFFAEKGAKVTSLCGYGSKTPRVAVERIDYFSFSDLNNKMSQLLSERKFDAVIHLAAVGDYSVSKIKMDGELQSPESTEKLPSDKKLVLELQPNFKILDRLRDYSLNKNIKVVGFKLTNGISTNETCAPAVEISKKQVVDYIVHNDLNEIDTKSGKHQATLYQDGKAVHQTSNKTELASALWDKLFQSNLSGGQL